MRILLISEDSLLQTIVKRFGENTQASTMLYNDNPKPIKVLSNFLSEKPSVLIVDDVYLKPNSGEILESIRNVNKEMKIIFASSNSSLELGKKVSQLGIYYYAIKPIEESEIKELLDSLLNTKSQQ
ncbi:MAG: response regulator, partial [Ignavibacteriaceae bacterium]